ncbi:MAG TPA: NADH-quinone oxidoreductase subunit C [Ktedonobacterales bacterium]|nr:NADH-quinone oxidoreductase subunit C [Ktedonobacterales bacterium]
MADEQQQPQQPLPAPTAPVDPTEAFIRARFAADLIEATNYRGETTLLLRPASIAAVCLALRDDPALRYNFLADITAVDWPEREPRFDVVYHLLSLETRAVVRLKVRVGAPDEETPEVPSVVAVWPTANWLEREIRDLFGITFPGHPDYPAMPRLLMPTDWVGHPLRKDYPLAGFSLPEPHWGGQVPFNQPMAPGIGRQTLRTPAGAPEIPPSPESADRPVRRRARGKPSPANE